VFSASHNPSIPFPAKATAANALTPSSAISQQQSPRLPRQARASTSHLTAGSSASSSHSQLQPRMSRRYSASQVAGMPSMAVEQAMQLLQQWQPTANDYEYFALSYDARHGKGANRGNAKADMVALILDLFQHDMQENSETLAHLSSD